MATLRFSACLVPLFLAVGMSPALAATLFVGAGSGTTPIAGLYSAAPGFSLQTQFLAIDPSFRGGIRVAMGDVDGDGVADYMTVPGSGMPAYVQVYSGVTHAVIRSFYAFDVSIKTGFFIAAGDVNGDGYADIAVSQDAGGTPSVSVWDGRTGSMITSFVVPSSSFSAGVRVAMGDVNGDHLAEIITVPGPGAADPLRVFDGHGLLQRAFYPFSLSFSGGMHVAVGDLTADGVDDIVVAPGGGGTILAVFDGPSAAPVLLMPCATDARIALVHYNDSVRPLVAVSAGNSTVSLYDVSLGAVVASFVPAFAGSVPVYLAGSPVPPSTGAFVVSAPATATAGSVITVGLAVRDTAGRPMPSFRSTVVWSATGASALLPSPYTFTAQDNGQHSFSVTPQSSGQLTLTASLDGNAGVTGSTHVSVAPAPAATNTLSVSQGWVSLRVEGTPNALYSLQAASDLSAWQPISTNQMPATGYFLYSEPMGLGSRFFRVRSQ